MAGKRRAHHAENVFYRETIFYTASEVGNLLSDAGFADQTWGQTFSKPLNEIQGSNPFVQVAGRRHF